MFSFYRIGMIGNKINDVVFNYRTKFRKIKQRKRLKEIVKDCEQLTDVEKRICTDFWNRYPVKYDSDWCRLYKSKMGIFDPRYIPDEIQYTDIDMHFNDWKKAEAIDDKNYYQIWFPEANQPETVLHIIKGLCYTKNYEPLSYDEAFETCLKHDKLIFKAAVNSLGGKNIFVWKKGNDSEEKLKEYLELAIKRKDYICQEFLEQCEKLSMIHSKCVNTIRIHTLLFNNEVHCLSAILKMGAGDMQVDNVRWGGCSCGISSDGYLNKNGSAANGNIITSHPSGFKFEGFKVPGFEEAKELVCLLQKRLGHFRMTAWDIAIDKNEKPVLIEANLSYGAVDFHQYNNGPFFGDLTEAVLDEIFGTNTCKIK